jgi:two-component system response regulator AtoC
MNMAANSATVSILVVDDDRETRDLVREALSEEGYNVVTSSGGKGVLETGKQECFDVIIGDLRLGPDLSGLDVLRAYKAVQPEAEVILLSGPSTAEAAIEALKGGAFHYLSKPFKVDELIVQVGRALANQNLIRENRDLKRQLGNQVQLSSLVGRSPAMLEVGKRVAMVADSRSPVLIYGERGTGKQLMAQAIHHNGPRAGQRFLAVNCEAPESLLEIELFGHVRGSSADAVGNKRGVFEEANGGTVFLGAVSEMSPALQVKLLQALEDQAVRRVGSSQPIPIDVRIIAASNRNLSAMVEAGRFRQDLYYRLRVIEIALPPLRERTEDIPLLVEHFLKRLAREPGRTFSVSPPALSVLVSYAWPGNVGELENALESAVALNRSGVLRPADFPPRVRADFRDATRLEDFCADLPSLDELEKRYVAHVLKATRANIVKTAGILGINRKTLYRMVQKFGLSV